jgi:hypothetical protein
MHDNLSLARSMCALGVKLSGSGTIETLLI